METGSIIRTLYLYLFALVGLVLVTIGTVSFVDMGLKAFVFTEAERQDRIHWSPPPMANITDRYERFADTTRALTAEEISLLRQSIQEYKRWRTQQDTVDPLTAQRHREAAQNLAMILVGVPLYLYHWRVIRREQRATQRMPIAGQPVTRDP